MKELPAKSRPVWIPSHVMKQEFPGKRKPNPEQGTLQRVLRTRFPFFLLQFHAFFSVILFHCGKWGLYFSSQKPSDRHFTLTVQTATLVSEVAWISVINWDVKRSISHPWISIYLFYRPINTGHCSAHLMNKEINPRFMSQCFMQNIGYLIFISFNLSVASSWPDWQLHRSISEKSAPRGLLYCHMKEAQEAPSLLLETR